MYLSIKDEIDTLPILKHIFDMEKEVFIPQYHGKTMEMVKLKSMEDYETLPLTKWNIKQPSITESQENALETGKFYDKPNNNKKIHFLINFVKFIVY